MDHDEVPMARFVEGVEGQLSGRVNELCQRPKEVMYRKNRENYGYRSAASKRGDILDLR